MWNKYFCQTIPVPLTFETPPPLQHFRSGFYPRPSIIFPTTNCWSIVVYEGTHPTTLVPCTTTPFPPIGIKGFVSKSLAIFWNIYHETREILWIHWILHEILEIIWNFWTVLKSCVITCNFWIFLESRESIWNPWKYVFLNYLKYV